MSLANTCATFVLVETTEAGWQLVDTSATRKLDLGNHEESAALRSFSSAVATFVNSHRVETIVIRRCTYKGMQRSGAGAIKMEALLQGIDLPVTLVAPQTISARFKKAAVEHPTEIFSYQHDAFEAAVFPVLS